MSYAYNNPTKVETEGGGAGGYPQQQNPAPMYPQQPPFTGAAPPSSIMVTAPVSPMNVVVQEKQAWSWSVTICSILTMIFCSPGSICGFVGLVNAIHAYVDHKVADYRRAAHKRQCAWGFTIAGIVIGVIVWIIIIALTVTGALAAKSAIDNYNNNYNNLYNN